MIETQHPARETVFTWLTSRFKFGLGCLDEVGADAAELDLRTVLVVSDTQVVRSGVVARAIDALCAAGVETHLFADVEIEPTDVSLMAAVEATSELDFDGIVAIGGGSVIDTAKAVNVLRTNGGSLLDYVNPPVGLGRAPDKRVLPLIAVPTTAGSGSENSAVCVMDLTAVGVKSGISHAALRPQLAIIDPLTTLTVPREATVAAGLDVLSHALESLTASRFDQRPRTSTGIRPTFCGANPVSDPLCQEAVRLVGRSFERVVRDGSDVEARTDMLLAATLTAVGSSTAGVHIPHACSYAIAAQVSDYSPPGYPRGRSFVPHGHAVASTLPSALRFTFPVMWQQQEMAAEALSGRARSGESFEPLDEQVVGLMRRIGAPNGLAEFGYTKADIPALVNGSLKQQRLLAGAPRAVDGEALEHVLLESLSNW